MLYVSHKLGEYLRKRNGIATSFPVQFFIFYAFQYYLVVMITFYVLQGMLSLGHSKKPVDYSLWCREFSTK